MYIEFAFVLISNRVSFLAGKYCKILQKNQPDLDITDQDILCLFIAGLCHDLGHGPFSHAWEHFLKKYVNDYSVIMVVN